MKTSIKLLVALNAFMIMSVSAASEVKSAPGKGIISSAYSHYKTEPSLYSFKQMPIEPIIKGVGRRFVLGTKSTLVQWTLSKGTRLPLHYHQHEQINIISKGKVKVYSQAKEYIFTPGQVMVFPPYVPHEFIALEETVLIGYATPVRQDFLSGLSGLSG